MEVEFFPIFSHIFIFLLLPLDIEIRISFILSPDMSARNDRVLLPSF